MTPLYRGLLAGAVQCLLLFSVAGKYALDRATLPRVWVKAAPIDPNLPVRGRYVSLRLPVDMPDSAPFQMLPVQLYIEGGRLKARQDKPGGTLSASPQRPGFWTLSEPVAYFIPDTVPDPSRRARDEELWVEVSVPAHGPPRPLHLGVVKDGKLTPLDLN